MRAAGLPTSLRLVTGLRVAVGAVLLLAPGMLLGDLPRRRIDRSTRVFARVLGVRHLGEALILTQHRTRRWMLAGAVVDATHAVTMAALGWLRPDRRALALTNAALASMFAAAGVHEARCQGGPRGGG